MFQFDNQTVYQSEKKKNGMVIKAVILIYSQDDISVLWECIRAHEIIHEECQKYSTLTLLSKCSALLN